MALVDLICEKLQFSSSKPTLYNLTGFLDDRFSDVTVKVSHLDFETRSYKLHRIILAGSSSVLHQSLVDTVTNELHQTLDVTFMSPAEFELLIVFMYTGKMYFKNVSELCSGLYAASLYNLKNLKIQCTERLQKKLMEDCGNALLILQLNERFNCRADNAALFEMVDNIIGNKYREILSSAVIEELERSTLKLLLQMDSVFGIAEIEIFRALSKWTNAECCRKGVERTPEQLQEVAGDLIYLIRYNMIPIEILGTEVVKSGLLPKNLFGAVFQRFYDDELDVPFCTQSRNQGMWQFESFCTGEEHSVQEVSRWNAAATLLWDGKSSASFILPAAALTNTRWRVRFMRWSDVFRITLRCESLGIEFRAASVRLFAFVEGDPTMWIEAAAIVSSDEEWEWKSWFSKRFSELPKVSPVPMQVRVQWSELEKLTHTPDFWGYGTVYFRCDWKLHGWKVVSPTANWWSLFSEPFGRQGALWRILVVNKGSLINRQLEIRVVLQHRSASVNWSELSWNCSLSLWGRQFNEKKLDMEQHVFCEWTVVENVKLESRNPLVLNVVIEVGKKS